MSTERPATATWAVRLCLLHAFGQALAAALRTTIYVMSGDPHVADRFPHDVRWFVPVTLALSGAFALAGRWFPRRRVPAWFLAVGAHVVLLCLGVLGDPTLLNVTNLLSLAGLVLLLSPATTVWVARARFEFAQRSPSVDA
jgi:hypothetical protein